MLFLFCALILLFIVVILFTVVISIVGWYKDVRRGKKAFSHKAYIDFILRCKAGMHIHALHKFCGIPARQISNNYWHIDFGIHVKFWQVAHVEAHILTDELGYISYIICKDPSVANKMKLDP